MNENLTEREKIFKALESFIAQRSGIEFREYASGYNDKNGIAAYNSDARKIAQHGRDARTLLSFAKMTYITVDELKEGFKWGFSGRLSLVESDGGYKLKYCTGQYSPTEYRAAVCAVLASALWQYYREPGKSGDDMRKLFRDFFGRGIQSRWFN